MSDKQGRIHDSISSLCYAGVVMEVGSPLSEKKTKPLRTDGRTDTQTDRLNDQQSDLWSRLYASKILFFSVDLRQFSSKKTTFWGSPVTEIRIKLMKQVRSIKDASEVRD